MGLNSNSFAKHLELLNAYQVAVDDYSAATLAFDQARGTSEYERLGWEARAARIKCEQARNAVAAHRLDADDQTKGNI